MGVSIVVWGLRWPIHGPLLQVGWVERRKGAFGDLERLLVVLEASWKAVKENGLILGVNIVVWGLGWGSPGSQTANTWLLATGDVG